MAKKNDNKKSKASSWITFLAIVFFLGYGRRVFTQRTFIVVSVIGFLLTAVGVFLTSSLLLGDNRSKRIGIANKVLIIVGVIFLMGSVYTGFIYSFIDGSGLPFWGISLVIGIAVGMFATLKTMKLYAKWKALLTGLLIAALVMFAASIYISHFNYIFDTSDPVEIQAEILYKDIIRHRKSPDEYAFGVEIDGKSFEVKVSYDEYEEYDEGDVYLFKKYNGAFGEAFYLSEE